MRFAVICLVLFMLASIEEVVADNKSLPDGTIYGHVYDADTKQPLSQAFVYCQTVKCSKPPTTNGSGYYATDPCFTPSQTYTIQCTRYGYKTATKSITTDQDGKAVADFDLEAEGASHSERVSGTGSIKKDYFISNKANDSAKVSVDIKNAAYYEYRYRTYSESAQCTADLDLIVGHADSIKCSGNAFNRSNFPTNITTIISNGNLTYNNSVTASIHGVKASQNITGAMGDNINAAGTAAGDNGLTLGNVIISDRSEGFKSTQKISIDGNTSTHARTDALTGPMKVLSYVVKGDRKLSTTADVDAGVTSVEQIVNPFEARQNSKGVIGGVNFDTVIEDAKGDKTIHLASGSGNLANLSQRALGQGTDCTMEYEYMPVSYSTGTYDTGHAEARSDMLSDKSITSEVIAEHCEKMNITHKAYLNDDPQAITGLNATAGPLKVESSIGSGGKTLKTTADIAAGIASIHQFINQTEAYQISKGVIGGAKFDTATTNFDGKIKGAHTTLGSGNLITLSQLASWDDALYNVEYGYMPVSYQTGTYDTNLNSSKIERN